jgi:hypothetical protein
MSKRQFPLGAPGANGEAAKAKGTAKKRLTNGRFSGKIKNGLVRPGKDD